ncbi:MAG TPA: ATP-binding protein [Polyangiaceae bacterium]|nr:ATP-binding protein [Polyangiaceae bacterium]
MPRSDLLLSLVKAGSKGDRSAFRRSLEAMVAEERGRQHHVVANQLAMYLEAEAASAPTSMRPISPTPEALVDEVQPERVLSDLVLPADVRTACGELIEEQHRGDLLRSHGLEPRHRLLLVGPPGNGKTSLAEAIAGELSVPVLRVRYDAVIGSLLGETAARLGRVFDHARTRQCVLFFDEFDAVGKERGDEHETGEIKRVVNSLLMRIDSLPAYVVVVAASNHPELLDRAVWRRFQIRAELPLPEPAAIVDWIRNFEAKTQIGLGLSEKTLVSALKGACYAELEQFCQDILRRVVLAGGDVSPSQIARAVLGQWKARANVRGG